MTARSVCVPVDSLLSELRGIIAGHGFILAGGTALAMQIGHRISVDIDLFSSERFRNEVLLKEIADQNLAFTLLQDEKGTLTLLLNNVKTSFFHYPYPLVEKTILRKGVPLAGVLDIAAMKVIAICQRGTKRDFIDIYFILQDTPFRKVAENMVRRFGVSRVSPVNIGKSLVYFKEGDLDPDVRYCGKRHPEWDAVKGFFRRNVRSMVYDLESAVQYAS